MRTEERLCQQCRNSFLVYDQDFLFYEKMKVPAPTFCPACRLMRRYAFRNQLNLYKGKCGLCGADMISMYSSDKSFTVYCQKCWWSDSWDPLRYGREYDFSKPFFTQFRELMNAVPRVALVNKNPVNSDYCNYATDNRNCYLCFSIGKSEDCLYMGPQITDNRSCISCSMSVKNELSYGLVDSAECYKVFFSQNSNGCLNSSFLFNCRNCQDCIGCVNLRNKQYCVFNEQTSKEGYFEALRNFDLGSFQKLTAFRERFLAFLLLQIHRPVIVENCIEVSGDNLQNCKQCKDCFAAVNSENCRYCFIANSAKDSYDVSNCYPRTEESYEVLSPVESTRNKFCSVVWSGSFDNQYVDGCVSSSNNFGSVSLKKMQYCVLNKQYSKSEYEVVVARIIGQMDAMPYTDAKGRIYRYGEFFPIEISPFAYNESVSFDYFPFSKEDVLREGFYFKDEEVAQIPVSLRTTEMADHIKDAGDLILQSTIQCAHDRGCAHGCTGAFRILKQELAFHRELGIPLPRLCVKCRNAERLLMRNPVRLWKRRCVCGGRTDDRRLTTNDGHRSTTAHFHRDEPCSNEFETTYAPERPEVVYCEACYGCEVG